MKQTIMSIHNNYIKWVRSLRTKKGRIQEGKFIIEGIKLLEEAMNSCIPIHSVLVDKSFLKNGDLLQQLERNNIPIFVVSSQVMKSVTDTQTPQGIAAVLPVLNRYPDCGENTVGLNDFIIGIDRIQDPGNLGTIIRTADAAGATGLLLSEGTVDVYNSKVIRSTMGSIFHVPFRDNCDLAQEVTILKSRGYTVIASHLKGESRISLSHWSESPIVLIIGNEASGVCEKVADMADFLYRLPMCGRAESLNASVAAGIMIYDIVRSKRSYIGI